MIIISHVFVLCFYYNLVTVIVVRIRPAPAEYSFAGRGVGALKYYWPGGAKYINASLPPTRFF